MTVAAPATATIGGTGAINLTFSGLTAATKYLGSVAYGGVDRACRTRRSSGSTPRSRVAEAARLRRASLEQVRTPSAPRTGFVVS